MKKQWIGKPLVCLLLFMASCGSDETNEATKVVEVEPTADILKSNLQLMPVSQSSRSSFAKVSGRVIPQNTTQLFAEVQGKVLPGGVNFKNGVSFSKGDVLLKLDNREFRLALEAQRSAFLNSLTSLMPDMKSDYADNYPNWLKYIQSYKTGTALPPLPETLSDKEKYYVTTYQIYSQYYTIKSQEERLSKYQIIAPYSGMITTATIDVGGLVSPGQPLGTIINSYNYELEAGVDIATSQYLTVGSKLTFKSNELPGSWTGTLIRKSTVLDPATQNIAVYFRLIGKGITSGMYLESEYQSGKLENVAVLPSSVVRRDNTVLILANGVISSKAVETVSYMTDSVAVKGLSGSDVVILNDFQTPVIGKKVAMQ
ncbi:MAG: HlyD family efflux transporter periplasmic adaptor subunit [Spirosomaceae bacterium]|nr:HlyD family efflux transporter periplasmic adaptor subunit [Spirosomataceae bacterium]